MTVGLQHSLIICPRCRDTGLVLIGDGYSVDRCPDCGPAMCEPVTQPVVHECRWTKISRVDGSTGTRQCIGYTCLICRSYRSAEEAA